ncbi:MAG: IS3 family transposase, partial [Anaerolineae bacterium]|nr:IS3 family transposase [Anaerolineae bacterium]NIN93703.1 IS3 family transposase [Anaerolineae bacterium]NIQ76750.1 IS3 family transposase [Anaerolineae bacterium]
MREENREISIRRLCQILEVPRSSFYYAPYRRKAPEVDEGLARRIWELIQEYPAYGIRKVWAVLRYRLGIFVNRKKVARIMKLKGWTMKQRRPRMRPRVRGSRSVAERSNERWATDVTHIYCGSDGWCHLPLVIDCGDRE